MRVLPRVPAALAVGALLVLSSPAVSAQEDATVVIPRAEAQATALRVSLFGNELVVAGADAAASSAPSAAATGTGALLATTGFGESSATADAATPTDGSEEPTCSELSLPADVPLPVSVVTACSASQASVGEGQGTASAQGQAADLTVLSTAESPVPIGEVTDAVVAPILDLLGSAPLPEQLQGLTAVLELALQGDVTVLAIEAGTTEATTTASSGAASATSSAEGATITLLDRSILGPVVTITVGRSVATATYDGEDLSASHVVAPVAFQFGPDVAALLGAPTTPIPVPPGQSVDLPLPAPLTSKITVAGGSDAVDDTTARATAANLRIDLATGLPGGGVVVAAADAAAAVEAPAEEEPPAATPPPAEPPAVQPAAAPPAPREALPRTGGEGRWISIAVLLAVGATVTGLVVRRLRTAPPVA